MNALSPASQRRRLTSEILVVLGLSFGMSALYATVSLTDRLTRPNTHLAAQTTTITASQNTRPVFDLLFQLLGVASALMPVALVLWLVWQPQRPRFAALGLTGQRFGRQLATGFGLAALIGIPGLAVYYGAVALSLNVQVVPTSLGAQWWTVPVLVLTAARAALGEELIVVAYLFHRLGQLAWGRWQIIVACALLRGSYHLYQGFGGALGNVAMGLVFGWVYSRSKRIWPLIIAHFLLDLVSFVGYALVVQWWPGLLPGTG